MQPSFLIENNFDTNLICGIDEAGRGPLAGPVVACCVLMNKDFIFHEINDSKKISKKNRLKIYEFLINNCQYGIGIVDEKTIDKINILQATKLAMLRAFENFLSKYNLPIAIIIVDGNIAPFNPCHNLTKILPIIKGDQKSLTIAAASIIAKEHRDQIMQDYHQIYPLYGFDKHSGYGTKFHLEAIQKFGICDIHRRSFVPIKTLF